MEIAKKVYAFILDTLQTILLAASIFLVIYIFFFRPFQVSGDSMYPTFKNKEYILTNLLPVTFKTYDIKKGDVIVFKAPREQDKDFIKRVIATAGDTVYLKEGFVYVNGEKLDESKYLASDVRTHQGAFLQENEPITVPEGNVIVFGDNRQFSSDSREWGYLEEKLIIGKSFFVYWPVNSMHVIANPYPASQ